MCMVSNVGDGVTDGWRYPNKPYQEPIYPFPSNPLVPFPSQQNEIDQLKRELELIKDVLRKAKIYDEETGQPDCEQEEKVRLIKEFADLLNVDLEDII